jgi:hypothetical protein
MSTGPEQINRELNHSLDCATKLYNSIVDFHPALVEEADAILHDDDTPLVTLVRLGGLLPYTPREADIATRRSNPEPKFYIAIEHSRISRAARRMGLAAVSAVFNTTDRLEQFNDFMAEQSKAYRACTWLGAGLMAAASVRMAQYMGAGYEPDAVGVYLLGAGVGSLYVANEHLRTAQ